MCFLLLLLLLLVAADIELVWFSCLSWWWWFFFFCLTSKTQLPPCDIIYMIGRTVLKASHTISSMNEWNDRNAVKMHITCACIFQFLDSNIRYSKLLFEVITFGHCILNHFILLLYFLFKYCSFFLFSGILFHEGFNMKRSYSSICSSTYHYSYSKWFEYHQKI